MNPKVPRQVKPRWFAAHAAIAVLSVAGAIGLQWLWKTPLATGTESWQPYLAFALVSATVWLVGTAWLHGSLTAGFAARAQILLQCPADIVVAIACSFILSQGHTSTLALSGVWPVCPLLIAIAAPSALILLATGISAEPQGPCVSLRRIVAIRFFSLVALLASLFLVARL